ncbi:MAG: single-stranded-DNA-specific exonuclease RecJ [Candidatus Doudnabacteria bacterium]|nr:single-stranded-DNA-specific exonuclease RecJ [Candidatus Doudnabacteria bacterium]
MSRTWNIQKQTEKDLITQLFANRGLKTEQEIANFVRPDYSQLHDPFIFKDMRKAVDRIWQAIENKEKILIYSDYDADAVTANAVLYRMFEFFNIKPEVYIPDRFSEGYGLNVAAFKKFKEQGVQLVLTVDCGTNSVEEAEFCAANGIDLIITDHHEITGETPKAFALINPKNPIDQYPYTQLVGVAVAFKVASAVIAQKEKHQLPDGYEKWLLDLVAIGTVADCHSLIGENRILVKYGLKVLTKTKWPGLKILLELAGLNDKPLDTYTLGFVLAPRINAAGRIEHASSAFNLLVSNDPAEALKLAQELDALNVRRQKITEMVMSEAREQVSLISERKVLMVSGTDWPKGVVGLVAGKLAEEFSKPVLVMERGALESTGSARSIPSFNVVEALKYSKDVLIKYGGHAAAAGFTLKTEHLDIFYKNLLDFADANINEEDLNKVINIEAEIKTEDISLQTIEKLDAFEPFGVDNTKPKLMLSNLEIVDTNGVGKDGKHLQISVKAILTDGSTKVIKCIAFNFGKMVDQLKPGEKVDLVFELIADTWQGRKNIKLRVLDFRKAV